MLPCTQKYSFKNYQIGSHQLNRKNQHNFLIVNTFTGIQQSLHFRGGFCCPTRVRTWTLLIQSQTCCQLHHRAMRRQKYKILIQSEYFCTKIFYRTLCPLKFQIQRSSGKRNHIADVGHPRKEKNQSLKSQTES